MPPLQPFEGAWFGRSAGGEGIRTPGTFRYSGFQVRSRPRLLPSGRDSFNRNSTLADRDPATVGSRPHQSTDKPRTTLRVTCERSESGARGCWAFQTRRRQADMVPDQRLPSLRRLPPWPPLGCRRLNDELPLPLGWQGNRRVINRGDDQRLHVRMSQLASRVDPNEAGLLSRSLQKLLRVGQLRSM